MSPQLFRAVADAALNGVLITEAHGDQGIVYANPRFLELTGYEEAEVLGRNCRFLQGQDRDQPALKDLRQAIRDQQRVTAVLRNYRKDGTLFLNEVTISPVPDDDGVVRHFLGIQKDVTRENQTRESIRQLSYRFQIACEAGGLSSWEYDADRCELHIDHQIWNLLGVTLPVRSDLNFDALFQFVHAADRDLLHELLVGGAKTQATQRAVVRFETASGKTLQCKVICREFPDSRTRTRRVGILMDLTELKSRESRFREVFDNSPLGNVLIDRAGTVLLINRKALELFDYSESEVVGENVKMLMPEPWSGEHDGYLKHYQETGKRNIIGSERDVQGKRRDGSVFPMRLAVGELKTDEGPQYIGTCQNLTDIRSLQKQLLQSQKMEAIGQLAGGLSHDFNNILGIVAGNIHLAMRATADEAIRARLRKASDNLERATKVTHSLLRFARRQDTPAEFVNLHDFLKSSEELIRSAITSRVVLQWELCKEKIVVHVDSAELENAILNLAINARDAMPEGGTLTIATKLLDDDSQISREFPELPYRRLVEISVTDTGCGMPAHVVSRVFEPLFTTKPHGKGTGLGMSMVYSYVKRCGGDIRINSQPGEGTSVLIYLPVASSKPSAVEFKRSQKIELPVGTERILLVDDEADLLAVTRESLVGLGYSVTCSNSGDHARILLEQGGEFDCVVTDIQMPGALNGVSLKRWLASFDPDIRVLLTSGNPDALEMTRGESESVLLKPYSEKQLATAIRKLLDSGDAP